MTVTFSRVTKANYIGLARLFILTPLAILFVLRQQWDIALVILIISGLSDILDGKIARYEGTESNFGVFLDLTADKLFVSAMFLCFLYQGLAPLWAVLVIILREVLVTGLRCFAAAENVVIRPTPLGGWKIIITFVTMFSIVLHLGVTPYLIIGTAFFTAISGVMYFYSARDLLTKDLHYTP